MSSVPKSEETRRKLIEAAGQIFADVGYEAATVRQITDRAQVNIAAVNYYFRDKLQLYCTVLQTVTGRSIRLLEEHCTHGTAEERLRQFVRCILIVERGEDRSWAYLLMAREIAALHEAQADLIVEATRPMHNIAEAIVRDLCGSASSSPVVKLAASLVVSLCVNRVPQQRLDQKLSPEVDFQANDIEQTSEQIYQFALAGIHALSKIHSPRREGRK